MKPQPVKYTTIEGGEWRDWGTTDSRRIAAGTPSARLHAIMFDDGTVFDMLNGWRDGWLYCTNCGARHK